MAGAAICRFVIGGADGIDPALRKDAGFSLSFGKMVWPHMLVRVMLAEQLYRAASILSGGPYHRDIKVRADLTVLCVARPASRPSIAPVSDTCLVPVGNGHARQ